MIHRLSTLLITFVCAVLTGCATRPQQQPPTQCGQPPLGPQGVPMMAPPQGMPQMSAPQGMPRPQYSAEEEQRRRDPNCKLVASSPGHRRYECPPPPVVQK